MTTHQFKNLKVGDRIRHTWGGDSWILVVVEEDFAGFNLQCESGTTGKSGTIRWVHKKQTRLESARYGKLPAVTEELMKYGQK